MLPISSIHTDYNKLDSRRSKYLSCCWRPDLENSSIVTGWSRTLSTTQVLIWHWLANWCILGHMRCFSEATSLEKLLLYTIILRGNVKTIPLAFWIDSCLEIGKIVVLRIIQISLHSQFKLSRRHCIQSLAIIYNVSTGNRVINQVLSDANYSLWPLVLRF